MSHLAYFDPLLIETTAIEDGLLQYYYIAYDPYSRVPQPFSSSLLSYSPPDLWVQQSPPQLQSKRIYNKECTRFVLHSPCAGSERATE